MAATVSMQPGELVYTASLGEAKRLTITEGPRLIVVSDPGAPVIPGNGCTSVDAHTAHCVPPDPQEQFPVERFGIDVRDGDDRVALGRGSVLTPFVVVLRAGNGDDRVAGCRSTVFADMGRGADRLSLCAVAAATVRGGPGPDLLRGGPDGFERLAGGDGNDVLVGGAGQDVLLGGAGADRLLGGEGDDLLRGGEGSDALMDANGRDRLLGGPDRDRLRTRDRQPYDHVAGGAEVDLCIADAGDWRTGCWHPIVASHNRRVPVLMYHVIGDPPGTPLNQRWVSPSTFAAQMRYLDQHGCNVVNLQDVYDYWHGGPLPRKAVVVSFDDGFDSHYRRALPILARHGWSGTLNLALNHYGPDLSQAEIRALLAANWELDSHTVTHAHLPGLSSTVCAPRSSARGRSFAAASTSR